MHGALSLWTEFDSSQRRSYVTNSYTNTQKMSVHKRPIIRPMSECSFRVRCSQVYRDVCVSFNFNESNIFHALASPAIYGRLGNVTLDLQRFIFSVDFRAAQSLTTAFLRLRLQTYFVFCFISCCRPISVAATWTLLWSPYVIGQTVIFSSCFFFLLSFCFLSSFSSLI